MVNHNPHRAQPASGERAAPTTQCQVRGLTIACQALSLIAACWYNEKHVRRHVQRGSYWRQALQELYKSKVGPAAADGNRENSYLPSYEHTCALALPFQLHSELGAGVIFSLHSGRPTPPPFLLTLSNHV